MSAATLLPVCDLDCEAAVISSVLLDPGLLDEVRDVVAAEDYYSDANRRIYSTIEELDAEGTPLDVATVASRLRTRGDLGSIGGAAYLAQLADATPATAHVAAHARVVAYKARQRRIVAVCQAQAAAGRGDVGEVDAWAGEVERAIYEAAGARREPDPAVSADELMRECLDDLGERSRTGRQLVGIETGWTDLDRTLGGWEDGVGYVIAGRPGMGKSAVMLQACRNVAARGKLGVFVSLEMPKLQLGQRLLAAEARVDLHRLRAADFRGGEWAQVTDAAERIRTLPLVICDRAGATPPAIRAIVRRELSKARRARADIELGLVAIDYVQLVATDYRKGENREQVVTRIAADLLRRFPSEFGCPWLVGSQLNRSVESRSRGDRRPQLADLRESGALEQDAYAVIFLYRDEMYNDDSPDKGIVEAIIAKHRNGRTGKVMLKFTAEYTRIDNLAHDEYTDMADDFTERYP